MLQIENSSLEDEPALRLEGGWTIHGVAEAKTSPFGDSILIPPSKA